MDKIKYSHKDALVPAGIFLIIFTGWVIMVASSNPFIHQFDRNLIGVICNTSPKLVKLTTTLTALGNTSVIVIETIILVLLLAFAKKYAYAFFTAATMIAANGYNWILKHVIQRQRPAVHHLVHADGYSFPSGHSVGSMTLFAILIVLTILIIKNKPLKSLLVIIWGCFPLFIGYTRIFTHVHYPSDVLGGFLEGITFVLTGYSILYHLYLKPQDEKHY